MRGARSARIASGVGAMEGMEMGAGGTGGAKRILTKDLDARVSELERKLSELTDQIGKLDERVMKIANSLATLPLRS
jgi:predicted transcriptional regulator